MRRRDVRYADSGGLQIAYEVVGDGPIDVLFAFDWASNLDLLWEEARNERFMRRFASYGRLIMFDMRGIGLSDPVDAPPPVETWMDDVGAVLDAASSERAALVGHGHAGQLCALFAASHPERASALVLLNSFARLARADDYPWGFPPAARDRLLDGIRSTWGDGLSLLFVNPELEHDEELQELIGRFERAAGGPRRAAMKQRFVFEVDVRDVLPAITVPTLVVQAVANPAVRVGHGRYLAEHIPGARYVEVGGGHWPWMTHDAERVMDEIERFLDEATGAQAAPEPDRVLMTVAFTDIVGSTEQAARLGDRRWRELLEVHDSVARREVAGARGRLVKSTGDGLLATFDGPARAIGAVANIERMLEPVGLHVRGGVHAGEVELRGDDIGGIAVHTAARVAAKAEAGEVLVSQTVRDLVAGSGLEFEDRGLHALKGVPGEWRLFALSR